MLIISRQQMMVLDSEMLERDVAGLAERLGREHPKESAIVPPDSRVPFIRESVEEARACGLRTKDQIYLFAEARMLFGPGFHKDNGSHGDLANCLQRSENTADEKANALSEELALHAAFPPP
ncbi:hypothetical protein OVA24_10645 [Luteolibacter sp. SL250]|uniref:hypothetical protein n=1 Tax=Luteolibacter sp. SL250 TaxID=2995170 RepID=UPI002270B512|nr:hypothetical protein [Luteolibacter sp. SL250]WAC21841.1 hypothetical protein OVA24_10645 [Luteolibacter sp. SL250]